MKLYIPQKSLGKKDLYILPLVRNGNNALCFIKRERKSDLFFMNPKIVKPTGNLEALTELTTYHSFTDGSVFNPKISEVLKQIPDELLHNRSTSYFEVVPPKEITTNAAHFKAGYHRATTILYARVKIKVLIRVDRKLAK